MPSSQQQQEISRMAQWAHRLNRVPRLWRILLNVLITLELVILASLVIDRLLIDQVLEGEMGRGTPALIEAAVGLLVYGVGWWALVGFDWDPERPWRAGTAGVLFVSLGAAGLLLLLLLLLFGVVLGLSGA